MQPPRPDLDALIIGGGPAGLTAAIYLARFRLRVAVIDRGNSRLSLIPHIRNHAGFPEGISGAALQARMRNQAEHYGARLIDAEVSDLTRTRNGFVARSTTGEFNASAVVLATGVTNNRPPMDDAVHAEALQKGQLRYCPVCDGYEVTDRQVGVVGTGQRGAGEAFFLRAYTGDVTLISPGNNHDMEEQTRHKLAEAGIRLVAGPARNFRLEGDRLTMDTGAGRLAFDSVYPALGSVIHSSLADKLGVALNDDGCLNVDAHQRTNVPFFYAAGDIVRGLDQISHAMGEAALAATALRNDLAECWPIRRESE